MVWVKRIVFGLFFSGFFLLMILQAFNYKPRDLWGDISMPGEPQYSRQAFMDASYQEGLAEYIRTHNPVFTEFIRVYNQYRFSLFNIASGGMVIGKDNYLYEQTRLRIYFGDDYMSRDEWNYYMRYVDFVSDTMQKLHKPMLYVNVGDKARIMHEYIPEYLIKPCSDSATYNLYNRLLPNNKRIDYIDFADYYLKIKDTCKTELYPKYSVHWSAYSVYLALDSMVKYTNAKLPQYEAAKPVLKGFEVSNKEKCVEFEMLNFLNCYWTFPHPINHYPVVGFTKNTPKRKPRVLIIGDSFGQFFPDFEYMYNAFDDSSVFIRYNAEYKRLGSNDRLTNIHDPNFDYWKEFDKADMVIFVSSDLNLGNFGFGFFEKAYDHFKGINNFIEDYHVRSVSRKQEGNHYVYTIQKGAKHDTYFKSRNPNVIAGKTYKISYWEKGIGELTMDFFPDNLPEKHQKYTNTEWQPYSWQFTMPTEDVPPVCMFRVYLNSKETVENELQFKEFKLEEVK